MKSRSLRSQREDDALMELVLPQLEQVFRVAERKEPEPGFAQRWLARQLHAARAQQRVRNNWMVAANGLALLLMLALISTGALALLGRSVPFLSDVFSGIVAMVGFELALASVVFAVISAVPVWVWLISCSIGGTLLVLWIAAFRRATFLREQS
ncbi:MAG: hypothetical protein WD751_00715 [Anaerolineales bacterium]